MDAPGEEGEGDAEDDAGDEAAEEVVAEVGEDGFAEDALGMQGEETLERRKDCAEEHEPEAEPEDLHNVDGEVRDDSFHSYCGPNSKLRRGRGSGKQGSGGMRVDSSGAGLQEGRLAGAGRSSLWIDCGGVCAPGLR